MWNLTDQIAAQEQIIELHFKSVVLNNRHAWAQPDMKTAWKHVECLPT